jgi:hypothetical protein
MPMSFTDSNQTLNQSIGWIHQQLLEIKTRKIHPTPELIRSLKNYQVFFFHRNMNFLIFRNLVDLINDISLNLPGDDNTVTTQTVHLLSWS